MNRVEAPLQNIAESRPANSQPPSGIHVLLVDDELLSRTVVGNLLRKCNYKVTVAESGAKALDYLEKAEPGTFNLILTDVMMPDVDGLDLLRFVRGNENLREVPVVMMSANEEQQTVWAAIQEGAEEYLVKPITKKELQNIWQHVWKRTWASSPGPNMRAADGQHPKSSGRQGPVVENTVLATRQHRPSTCSGVGGCPGQSNGAEVLAPWGPIPGALKGLVALGCLGWDSGCPKVRLSQWLTRPHRVVDRKESFWIFCEVLLLLERKLRGEGQGEGREYPRLRPSKLMLSANGSVTDMQEGPPHPFCHLEGEGMCSAGPPLGAGQDICGGGGAVLGGVEKEPGTSGEVDDERDLYGSPEETEGQEATLASNIFSLGLLFFELHYCASAENRAPLLRGVKQRIFPIPFLKAYPHEVAFLMTLLHPDPTARPTLPELLTGATCGPLCTALRQRHAQREEREARLDHEVLKDFLSLMRRKKSEELEQVKHEISHNCDSLKRVKAFLDMLNISPEVMELAAVKSPPRSHSLSDPASAMPSVKRVWVGEDILAAKRLKLSLKPHRLLSNGVETGGGDVGEAECCQRSELVDHRWQKVLDAFPVLEKVFSKRKDQYERKDLGPGGEGTPVSPAATSQPLPEYLSTFADDLINFTKYQAIEVRASIGLGDVVNTRGMVCSVAIDRDDEFFATACVNKKIKIFEISSTLKPSVRGHFPVLEISSRSRLSSVCWSSYVKSQLASADYEGVVQLWDVNTNAEVMQFEEHAKRVWSVNFSQVDPSRLVSGSDDGTVKLWSINHEASLCSINVRANVCSVQFSPTSPHIIALGSANSHIYLYDLRNTTQHLARIMGHGKAVSYVRFMGESHLVSASTDNTVKIWDMNSSYCEDSITCENVLMGHTNEKNFVGLAVTPEGYIACGSETNTVFCYYKALPMPILSHGISTGEDGVGMGGDFVSCVCWGRRSNMLLAGNSAGLVKVMSLTMKEGP